MGGYYARFKVIPRTAEKLIDIRTIALAGATTYRFVCGGPLMFSRLKFSQKILLAACLVVTAAFALFTLYNDYQQRNTIRAGLESDLKAMGDITAQNIENWLSGRILLVESMAQSVANDSQSDSVVALLEQQSMASTFRLSYFGGQDGSLILRPFTKLPDDYEPRDRPWYKMAIAAKASSLTEPYIDDVGQDLVLTVATPVVRAGQTLGVMGGDLSLKTMVDAINALDFGGMGHAFLVNARFWCTPTRTWWARACANSIRRTRRAWTAATAKPATPGATVFSASARSPACHR